MFPNKTCMYINSRSELSGLRLLASPCAVGKRLRRAIVLAAAIGATANRGEPIGALSGAHLVRAADEAHEVVGEDHGEEHVDLVLQ